MLQEEVPAAEEIYDVSIQHGRLLVAASRLAQLHYSGSACSREGAQQLCRDMAPLRNGLLCTSDHSTEVALSHSPSYRACPPAECLA